MIVLLVIAVLHFILGMLFFLVMGMIFAGLPIVAGFLLYHLVKKEGKV